MNKIIISNGTDTVETVKNLDFGIELRDCDVTVQTANKTIAVDRIGYKYVLTIPCGILEPDKLATLVNMVRHDKLLSITFPDIDGDKTRDFIVSLSSYRPANYDETTVSYWKTPLLTAVQQGVELNG